MQGTLSPESRIRTKCENFRLGQFEILRLTDKQSQAMRLLTDHETDELLFGGAANGGKSFGGCEWLLWNCLSYPGTRWFVGRKTLKQIRKSTVVTFRKVCKKHQIPDSEWRYNDNAVTITFRNGSAIEGIELADQPNDPDRDAFGSLEYTGGWIEEAGGVPFKSYEVMGLRIGRHMNDHYGIRAKLLITCNPSRNWLYSTFYKPWKQGVLPDGKVFLPSLVLDNTKRESGSYEKLQGTTGATRQRLLLGNWDYEDDPLALTEFEAVTDMYTNDYIYADYGKRRLICDVALHGSDLLRAGVFYGRVLMEQVVLPKSGGKQVIDVLKGLQAKRKIPGSRVLYDADGAGGFVGQKGGFIPNAIAFHGNGRPHLRKDEKVSEYANLKAQCGYSLGEAINGGEYWAMAVKDQDEQDMLNEEISASIKRAKEDSDQKLRLIDKALVREAIGRSPDFADLFLMNEWYELLEAVAPKPFKRTLKVY